MSLDPKRAAMLGRIGAAVMHATHDSREVSRPGRAAFMARFEREVDPDGILSADERARRSEHAKRAYFARLAMRRHHPSQPETPLRSCRPVGTHVPSRRGRTEPPHATIASRFDTFPKEGFSVAGAAHVNMNDDDGRSRARDEREEFARLVGEYLAISVRVAINRAIESLCAEFEAKVDDTDDGDKVISLKLAAKIRQLASD